MGFTGVHLSLVGGQPREMCEVCRIREANQSLKRILGQFVGTRVTEEDRVIFERLEETNKKSKERLFGSRDFVWYLIHT